MASRIKIYMSIPEYTEVPHRSCAHASKMLRMLLKGYYLEPKPGENQPRMPRWWWVQKNFAQIHSVCGLRGTLIIMREKRGTRRGKSLYYQTLREKGIYPRDRNVPPTINGGPMPPAGHGFRAVPTRAAQQGNAFGVDPFARPAPRRPVEMRPAQAGIGNGWFDGGEIHG